MTKVLLELQCICFCSECTIISPQSSLSSLASFWLLCHASFRKICLSMRHLEENLFCKELSIDRLFLPPSSTSYRPETKCQTLQNYGMSESIEQNNYWTTKEAIAIS